MNDLSHIEMSNDFEFQTIDPGLVDHSKNDEAQDSSINSNPFDVYLNEDKQRTDLRAQTTQESLGQNCRSECDYDDPDADYDHELEEEIETSKSQDKEQENGYRALIKDQEHYQYLLHSRLAEEREEGLKKFVDTFPKDPVIQRSWVKRIFEAILNLDDIIDKETKYHNSSSQAARRVRDGYYPEIEIEKTAWKLMLNARDAQIGVRLIDKYHGVKFEDPVWNGVGVFSTWADRMEAIINTLRVSKAACKQLMDPHYIDRIVVCPNAERQMKKNNKRINTERDIQNQLGRRLLDLKVVPIAEVEREVEKLQNIKEAHRSAVPSKMNRIKKEVQTENCQSFLTAKSPPSVDQERSNTQKRKRSQRKRSHTSYLASDEEFEEFEFNPEGEKGLSGCFADLPSFKRPRILAGLENNSLMTFEPVCEKPRDYDEEIGINGGICDRSPKLNPNSVSTDNDLCLSETLPTFDLNPHQEFSRFQASYTIPSFQLGQNLDIFQNSHPISISQGSLSESIHPSHQARSHDPKIAKRYSEIICNLLSIDAGFAMHFSLKDLRLYAHAYNSKFILYQWTHPDLGPRIAKGCCVYEYTGQSSHISRFFPSLSGIAFARGDVDRYQNIVPGTEISHVFNTEDDQLMDQALGIVENPCGLSLFLDSH